MLDKQRKNGLLGLASLWKRSTDSERSREEALQHAILADDPEKVRRLIAQGADVNTEGGNVGRPLLIAALQNRTEIVQVLLAAGAMPDLWEAVALNDHRRLKTMLSRNIDLDARHECYGFTLLSKAAEQGSVESVRLLLEHGAEVDGTTQQDYTPLALAALHKRSEVLPLLLAAGASVGIVEATLLGDEAALLRSIEAGADLDAPDATGMTPLIAAAACGHIDLMRLLLAHGADLQKLAFKEKSEHSALTEAIVYDQKDAVNFLLDAGMEIDAPGHRNNPYLSGITPLFHAIICRLTDMAQLLLDRGASVKVRDVRGNTPLHWAMNLCKPEIVRALLAAGADVNATDAKGQTPLMLAAAQLIARADIQCACARLLIDHGADVNAGSARGGTALIQASMYGHAELAKLLLDAGADLDAVDEYGFTALTTIGIGDREEVLALLRARAAKPPHKPSRFPFPH